MQGMAQASSAEAGQVPCAPACWGLCVGFHPQWLCQPGESERSWEDVSLSTAADWPEVDPALASSLPDSSLCSGAALKQGINPAGRGRFLGWRLIQAFVAGKGWWPFHARGP